MYKRRSRYGAYCLNLMPFKTITKNKKKFFLRLSVAEKKYFKLNLELRKALKNIRKQIIGFITSLCMYTSGFMLYIHLYTPWTLFKSKVRLSLSFSLRNIFCMYFFLKRIMLFAHTQKKEVNPQTSRVDFS